MEKNICFSQKGSHLWVDKIEKVTYNDKNDEIEGNRWN